MVGRKPLPQAIGQPGIEKGITWGDSAQSHAQTGRNLSLLEHGFAAD